MRNFLPSRFALLAVLVASVAMAQDDQPRARSLYLSSDPRDRVPRVYVGGRVATVLRFEQAVDPARTSLLGWKGWFEPLLAGGSSVVLVPLQRMTPEDQFLLQVTLADGTELPFTVTARESGRVDQQVNVFPDRESLDALRSRVSDAERRERQLREENERYHKEEVSVNHALAQLLANGGLKLTPFDQEQKWVLKGEGVEVTVRVLTSKTVQKTAVLFAVVNQDPSELWKLGEARLSTLVGWEPRPFALREEKAEIAPGASGRIAIVADDSVFDSKQGPEKLALELFRSDGMQQVQVVLEQQITRR
ncbi:DUF2381 family protein [Hyalangium versicolor]|uniref:DUF2381 family protein n=1 Tax=Hyalangium versicolor TaxID=2861190 RepID=UPI001CCBEBAA|nr:DUF2381 family protein [Hyalangium versicolor]